MSQEIKNFNKIAETSFQYRCVGNKYIPIGQASASIQSNQLFAVFISWQATTSNVKLTFDSCKALRQTNQKFVVDLTISIGSGPEEETPVKHIYKFDKQSIFETFTFPGTWGFFLKIFAIVYVYEDLKEELPEIKFNNEAFQIKCSSDVAESLSKMLTEKKFTDVTLQCEGGNLRAHKIILASRSVVFEKMFQSNMLEVSENEVPCKFDVASMEALLTYLYSGQFDKSKVASFFEIADYYDILSLKEACETVMMDDMDVNNAICGLILAHTLDKGQLKQRILEYINKNAKAVVDSEDYKNVLKDGSPVMMEIINLIVTDLANR